MNTIMIALFGLCVALVAHGSPISQFLKWSPRATELDTLNGDNTESGVTSMFSGGLSLFSDMFHRLGGYPDDIYYYQAIQIQVKTSGTYTFTSDSYLDTIGYLYENSFDLTNLEENLMVQDDNSGGSNLQFRFETTLEAERTYILVVTTNVYGRTGRFSVSAHGPDSITFLPIVSELFENLG
ncbi:unnamed protein product [Rotaria socialis]